MRGVEVLLDEQDRHALRLDLANDRFDLAHDQRREPFGRFVEEQHARPCTSARAIASICFSPPEISSPLFVARSRSRGKRA